MADDDDFQQHFEAAVGSLFRARAEHARATAELDRKIEAMRGAVPDEVFQRIAAAFANIPAHDTGGKVPSLQLGLVQPQANGNAPRGLWEKLLPETIDQAGRGLTVAELTEMLKSRPELGKISIAKHSLSVTVSRLSEEGGDGPLRRRGRHYFTPALLAKLEESGEAPELVARGVPLLVLSLPALAERWMSVADIVAAVQQAEIAKGNKAPEYGRIYNSVARLADKGDLRKEGALYRLPPKQNEPSAQADGSSSSVSGSQPPLDLSPVRTKH